MLLRAWPASVCWNGAGILCTRVAVWQVVALGNLLPPEAETDELDSWMYQTVGHQLVAAYASATGLPLLRRRIFGSSKHMVCAPHDPASPSPSSSRHTALSSALNVLVSGFTARTISWRPRLSRSCHTLQLRATRWRIWRHCWQRPRLASQACKGSPPVPLLVTISACEWRR